MSVHSRTESNVLYDPPEAGEVVSVPQKASAREWQWWGIGLLVIAIFYAALLNPYWVPSGDGDLYVSIARSVALGEGLRFNGQPVNICPPGWPLLLAGLMKISPTFLCFKIFMILCQTIQLGMWYWVLKRLVPTKIAVLAVALTAILNHVYSLTFWTHTEAAYCVIATGATLLSFHIAEGRGGLRWRLPLLFLLCFLCVFIRWAGTLQILLLGSALLHGMKFWDFRSRIVAKHTLIAVACAAVLAGSLFVLRHKFKLTKAQEVAMVEAGGVFEESQPAGLAQETEESRAVGMINIAPTRELTVYEELWRRFNESGRWFSWLCWQPFRFTASVARLATLDIVVGWIAMLVFLVPLIKGISRYHWLWLGAAVYCGVLAINWPNANARYLVPIAPLLLSGIMTGAKQFFGPWRISRKTQVGAVLLLAAITVCVTLFHIYTKYVVSPAALWTIVGLFSLRLMLRGDETEEYPLGTRWLRNVFVTTVILCNLVLYGIDVRVARADDFYGKYEAGFNGELISACYLLNEAGIGNKEFAVAERYVNFNRSRKSKYATRAAVLLTGRTILSVKDKLAGVPKTGLLRWLQSQRLKTLPRPMQNSSEPVTLRAFYLDQRPNVPWRVWHFKLSRDFNQKLVSEPLDQDDGGWKLYDIEFDRVPLTPTTVPATAPTTVPTTEPATQPTYEWRRTVTPVAVPVIKHWPTRVPGM